MSERRLIDANPLIAELRKSAEYHEARRLGYYSAITHIKEQLVIDAVELPCKIGDAVWTIRHFHSKPRPQQGVVSEMYFTQDMKLNITVKYVGRGLWGEKIFATYEEAQAAIERRCAGC